MSLLDRLRPKWQSPDAEVRAQAVRELPKGEIDLLAGVARQDPDPRVRRIAVKRIESPRLLLELAESDADESLRSFARKRARQILVQIACDERDVEESKRALALLSEASDRVAVAERARFSEVRASAFDALDEDALVEVVRRAKEQDLRVRALAKIASPQALKRVVVDEASGDLGLAALSRIDDVATLEAICDHHALPRSIRRQAFSKLEKMVPADHPIKARAREERYQELCRDAQALAEQHLPPGVGRIADLRERWAAIEREGLPEPGTRARFEASLSVLEALPASSRPRAAPEPASTTPAPPDADPRFRDILDRVGSLADPDLPSALDSIRAEWEDLTASSPPPAELQTRFRRALKSASARLDRLRAIEAAALEAASLAERAETTSREPDLARAHSDLRALERAWSRLPEPPDAALEERFRLAISHLKTRQEEERAKEDEIEQKTLRELEAFIQLMETLALSETLSIKDADRVLKESQEFLKDMGPLPSAANRKKARKRLLDARDKLFKRTQDTRELEEWKRWANVDVQETLIDRIEKLKLSNDIPKVAKELRRIHEDWKQAGTATPDKAQDLWARYKTARDEIKARCDAFFEKQNEERRGNQALKEALCVRVESLKDSEDWKQTADTIKEIQAEWKKIGPARKEVSDALWKRFRAACDHFFDRRKEGLDHLKSEREANLAAKIALCERAEAIQDSTDWAETADELKRIQSRWREIGAVPRKKSDEVWARFRAACDRFFDRYKRREEVEAEEQARRRKSLIEELTALGPENRATDDGLAERVSSIWTAWKNAGPPPEPGSEIAVRFENEVSAILLGAPAAFAGTELDPSVSAKKRGKIVGRIEALVGGIQGTKPQAPAIDDLAQRLKDALANNTIGGGRKREEVFDWRQASEEVARLQANWAKTAPVPGEEGRALNERFERAFKSFVERRPPERQRATSRGRAPLSRPQSRA
jgi:hypothetical protein